MKKRKLNSRCILGSSCLQKLVVPQSTWNLNLPVYVFCMCCFSFLFSTVMSVSEMQRVCIRSHCLAVVWVCKGDISSWGCLVAFSLCLGLLFLSFSGITRWDLMVAAKFWGWADVRIVSEGLLLSINTALLSWGRWDPCPQDTFSH